jgi:hypothetical protein
VKTCSYCGREGDDTQVTCKECGTLLTEPEPQGEPKPPNDLTGLRKTLLFAAGACFLLLCYFASLGPVLRLYTPAPVITGTTTGPGINSVTMVKTFPAWIGIAYYPALALQNESEIYRSYLDRWEKPAVELSPGLTTTVIRLNTN